MIEPPSNPNTLKRRDPREPWTPAHDKLLDIIAEHLVEEYLAEEDAK